MVKRDLNGHTPPYATAQDPTKIDKTIVEQAANWLVRLLDDPSPELARSCQDWCRAHAHHELAWQRLQSLQHEVNHASKRLEPGAAQQALQIQHRKQGARRQILLAALAVGGTVGVGWTTRNWTLVQSQYADYHTGAGEQRTVLLSEGTKLILNTRSAVNIVFTDQDRIIELVEGEILVETGKDQAGRTLWVSTSYGDLFPQGTRFTVRLLPPTAKAMLAVQAGAVRMQPKQPHNPPIVVEAGQHLLFNAQGAMPSAPSTLPVGDAWAQGLLVANRMPLSTFVAELNRYCPGWIRYAPELAHYQVSGTFPVQDSDAALTMLADLIPVQIQTRTRYWVTLLPRPEPTNL